MNRTPSYGTVIATVAVHSVLLRLRPSLERLIGQELKLRVGTIAKLKLDIENGTAFDLAILSATAIGELVSSGHLDPTSSTPVAAGGLGIAVPDSAADRKPETPEDIKQMILDAKRVVIAKNGGSHAALRRMFESLDVADAVDAKLLQVESTTPPLAVASRQADLGFSQISEIVGVRGVRLAGPLPGPLQVPSAFSAAVSSSTSQIDMARAVVNHLVAQSSRTDWIACGLNPA